MHACRRQIKNKEINKQRNKKQKGQTKTKKKDVLIRLHAKGKKRRRTSGVFYCFQSFKRIQ